MRRWLREWFYEWFAVATILDLAFLAYIAYRSHR